jgi:hypothetical protein
VFLEHEPDFPVGWGTWSYSAAVLRKEIKMIAKVPYGSFVKLILLLLSLSGASFADRNMSLAVNSCREIVGSQTLSCTWTDQPPVCSLTASMTHLNATCIAKDASGRAGLQVVSPDGTQITTTKCSTAIVGNDFCDTILSTQTFESTTTTINPTPNGCDPPPAPTDFTADQDAPPTTCDPILIDISGQGFHLTSAADGVVFDFFANGHPIRIPWSSPASGNAFLVLDRNHNGKIDDATELFSNLTIQTKSPIPNGFMALAEFDKPENGGNGDGIIDEKDAVFSHLLLWVDENHDGISQPNELHSLPELGVFSLGLKFKESRRTDEFGNVFRFRAKVNPRDKDDESSVGAMAYDVFLVSK